MAEESVASLMTELKVYKRLENGSGDDLCFYYQVIKHKIEQSTESA